MKEEQSFESLFSFLPHDLKPMNSYPYKGFASMLSILTYLVLLGKEQTAGNRLPSHISHQFSLCQPMSYSAVYANRRGENPKQNQSPRPPEDWEKEKSRVMMLHLVYQIDSSSGGS